MSLESYLASSGVPVDDVRVKFSFELLVRVARAIEGDGVERQVAGLRTVSSIVIDVQGKGTDFGEQPLGELCAGVGGVPGSRCEIAAVAVGEVLEVLFSVSPSIV